MPCSYSWKERKEKHRNQKKRKEKQHQSVLAGFPFCKDPSDSKHCCFYLQVRTVETKKDLFLSHKQGSPGNQMK